MVARTKRHLACLKRNMLAVASLALLRAPPLRLADGLGAVRSAVHMATSVEAKKEPLWARNKMSVVSKNTKPRLRGKRLSPAMIELTGRFKKQYQAKDLEVLWAALVKIYGSQQLAEQAAIDNPQILNPSYSFCNTMLASAEVLENMMSREEARPVRCWHVNGLFTLHTLQKIV